MILSEQWWYSVIYITDWQELCMAFIYIVYISFVYAMGTHFVKYNTNYQNENEKREWTHENKSLLIDILDMKCTSVYIFIINVYKRIGNIIFKFICKKLSFTKFTCVRFSVCSIFLLSLTFGLPLFCRGGLSIIPIFPSIDGCSAECNASWRMSCITFASSIDRIWTMCLYNSDLLWILMIFVRVLFFESGKNLNAEYGHLSSYILKIEKYVSFWFEWIDVLPRRIGDSCQMFSICGSIVFFSSPVIIISWYQIAFNVINDSLH